MNVENVTILPGTDDMPGQGLTGLTNSHITKSMVIAPTPGGKGESVQIPSITPRSMPVQATLVLLPPKNLTRMDDSFPIA